MERRHSFPENVQSHCGQFCSDFHPVIEDNWRRRSCLCTRKACNVILCRSHTKTMPCRAAVVCYCQGKNPLPSEVKLVMMVMLVSFARRVCQCALVDPACTRQAMSRVALHGTHKFDFVRNLPNFCVIHKFDFVRNLTNFCVIAWFPQFL